MTDILQKYARLRELYPDQVKEIEAEEKRVTNLLKQKEYYSLDTTKALLELCRKDVVAARRTLATDRTLTDDPDAQRQLWAIVDARLWFLERVAQNYDAELDAIDRQLEAELHP
jgi:hypothetical protein